MTQGDVFTLGLIIGTIVLYATFTRLRRWLHRRKWQEAKQAEIRAAAILAQHGFRVLRRQPTARILIKVNGKPHYSTIRADFLARRGFFTYIVEVKSGRTAPRLWARTRRQLLEYQLAFHPHGMILVDMEKEKVKEVVIRPGPTWRFLLPVGLAGLAGLLLGGFGVYTVSKGTWLCR